MSAVKYIRVLPLSDDDDETTFVELYEVNDKICVRIYDLHGGALPTIKQFISSEMARAEKYFLDVAHGRKSS